jgi:hypothetical protein
VLRITDRSWGVICKGAGEVSTADTNYTRNNRPT